MEVEKNYESMKRKELRQCLKAAREREEEERKILDSAEAFSGDYEKKQKQYRVVYEEIETIKKEISKRNMKFKVMGVLLLLLIIGMMGVLHKANIRKWQNSNGEVIYDVSWWPGVDFVFTVYEDHVRIIACNKSDIEYIMIPETIWFKPVTEIGSQYFSGYYYEYDYDSKEREKRETYRVNSEKIVFSDNIDNINDVFGEIARIRERLLRWGEEGIAAYLTDVGVEDVEAVKEQLIFTEQEISYIAHGGGTEEEVREAIDIMINGGDIEHIPDDIYLRVKYEIDRKMEDLDISSIYYWLE